MRVCCGIDCVLLQILVGGCDGKSCDCLDCFHGDVSGLCYHAYLEGIFVKPEPLLSRLACWIVPGFAVAYFYWQIVIRPHG